MKTLVTLTFALLLSFTALANEKQNKVTTITKEVNLTITVKVKPSITNEVARVYKNKNYLVTKALQFKTKRNKAKMA